MADFSMSKLVAYIEAGINIYLFGDRGTGKTQRLKAASNKLNYKLGYMSAPTIDAYIDLVGIPIAEQDKALKKKVLEFVRKKDFDDIEVLFIDELPRGELKTLNALFEIMQEGTINGEDAFPKLKCVVAAGNPMTEDYVGQNQLDAALLDRFEVFMETSHEADLPYFVDVFGKHLGSALVNWHKTIDFSVKEDYLSPRRLEKIGHIWNKFPDVGTLRDMMPPGGTFNVDLLQRALADAADFVKVENDPNAPIMKKIRFMDAAEIRSSRDEILANLDGLSRKELAQVTERISIALSRSISVKKIVNEWYPALEYFTATDKSAMMASWNASQNAEFQKELAANKIAIGKNLHGLS